MMPFRHRAFPNRIEKAPYFARFGTIGKCDSMDHRFHVKQLLSHLGRSYDAALTSRQVGTKLERRVKKQPIRIFTNRL